MSQTAYLGRLEAEKGRVSNSPGPFPSASSVDLREDLTPGARLPLSRVLGNRASGDADSRKFRRHEKGRGFFVPRPSFSKPTL